MSHIADWLTAIGHNYFIVIIGAVEILVAVMLITSCVIPILVLLVFFWLIKVLLDVDISSGKSGSGE